MPFGEQFAPFYPGLIPKEAELWRLWLRDHEGEWDRFEYNVGVGQGINVSSRILAADPALDARMKETFRQLTQKRIDVLGWKGPEAWIFEVEERPGMRALGQLTAYQTLLPKTRPDVGSLELALVCERIGSDMLEAFEAAHVLVWQRRQTG
jgi:hypothetical protein